MPTDRGHGFSTEYGWRLYTSNEDGDGSNSSEATTTGNRPTPVRFSTPRSAQERFDTLGPVANSVYADGLSSDAGLSTLTSHFSDLDIAARRSASLAAEPLPSTPILGRTADINALAGPRDLLASGSAQALGIGQRIGDAMAYSLTMSLAFNLPELPEQAPPGQVDEIALQTQHLDRRDQPLAGQASG